MGILLNWAYDIFPMLNPPILQSSADHVTRRQLLICSAIFANSCFYGGAANCAAGVKKLVVKTVSLE